MAKTDEHGRPHLEPSDLKPSAGSGGPSGLATGLQPSGMAPGGGHANLQGSLGTGGGSTAGRSGDGDVAAPDSASK